MALFFREGMRESLKVLHKTLQAAKPQPLFLVLLFIEALERQIWENVEKVF